MLSPSGEITFTQELMDLVDEFLADYQARQGILNSDLERGLVIAYAIGVMRCDLENVWDSLGLADVFGSLQPRALFEECSEQDRESRKSSQAEIVRQMAERGWFSQRTSDAP